MSEIVVVKSMTDKNTTGRQYSLWFDRYMFDDDIVSIKHMKYIKRSWSFADIDETELIFDSLEDAEKARTMLTDKFPRIFIKGTQCDDCANARRKCIH
jgi:hypothetical protein